MIVYFRYWLKGPKKGKSDVFIKGLPGLPDNIRPRKAGGFYISLIIEKQAGEMDFFSFVSDKPLLRQFLVKSRWILRLLLDKLYSVYPHEQLKKWSDSVSTFSI